MKMLALTEGNRKRYRVPDMGMKHYDLLLTRITMTSIENRSKGDKSRSKETSFKASAIIVYMVVRTGVIAMSVLRSDQI